MKGLYEFKRVKVKLLLRRGQKEKKKKKKNNTSGYCDVQFSKCVLTVHSISSIDAAAAMENMFSNAM